MIDIRNFPKDLRRYLLWFPMLLLIPSDTWDEANRHLGPNSSSRLNGIYVMNGKFEDNRLIREEIWDRSLTDSYVSWVTSVFTEVYKTRSPIKLRTVDGNKTAITTTTKFLKQINDNPVTYFPDINPGSDKILNIVSR